MAIREAIGHTVFFWILFWPATVFTLLSTGLFLMTRKLEAAPLPAVWVALTLQLAATRWGNADE